jgi:hypothetical protein
MAIVVACWGLTLLLFGGAMFAVGQRFSGARGRGGGPPTVVESTVATVAVGDEIGAPTTHRHSILGPSSSQVSEGGRAPQDSRPANEGSATALVAPVVPPVPKPPILATATEANPRVSRQGGGRGRPSTPSLYAKDAAPLRTLSDNVLIPRTSWFATADPGASDAFPAQCSAQVCTKDRSLGTALTWARSPAEASKLAEQSGKLVMLLHVSGNFENPGFT